MACYEYTRSLGLTGILYLISSVIGSSLILFLMVDVESFAAIFFKYIALGTFSILALVGLTYLFLKGKWHYKIDETHFEYITPFGKSKCFRVPIEAIEKLEIQQSKSVDSVYYYLHLKNQPKYRLDTEAAVSMSKVERCLRRQSIAVEYSRFD